MNYSASDIVAGLFALSTLFAASKRAAAEEQAHRKAAAKTQKQ